MLSISLSANSQNSYGWERIFNSLYGINGFHLTKSFNNTKFWMVRPVGDLFGTGNYEFLKYNYNSDRWYVASNSIFKGIYYSYYVGGGHSISGHALPNSMAISPADTNFTLINTVEPHQGNPPYDIRLFYSYDNGATKADIPIFQFKSVSGLCINGKNDSINYACFSDTIFRSVDRGISWSAVSVIPYFKGTLTVNPNDTNFVYAMDDSLFISSNGGSNFNYVLNKKFSNLLFKFSDKTILATVKNVIYRSTNTGFNWYVLDSLSDSINAFESDPDNEDLIYAGTRKQF